MKIAFQQVQVRPANPVSSAAPNSSASPLPSVIGGPASSLGRRVTIRPRDLTVEDAVKDVICDVFDLVSEDGTPSPFIGEFPTLKSTQLGLDAAHTMLKQSSWMLDKFPHTTGVTMISVVIGSAELFTGLALKTLSPAEAGFEAVKQALGIAGLVASALNAPAAEQAARIGTLLVQAGEVAYLIKESDDS